MQVPTVCQLKLQFIEHWVAGIDSSFCLMLCSSPQGVAVVLSPHPIYLSNE